MYIVWLVGLALIGVLAWAVMRSKAPAPEMGGGTAVVGGAPVAISSASKPVEKLTPKTGKAKSKKR